MNRRRRLAGIGRLLSVRAITAIGPVANAGSPRRCLFAIEASELVTDDPGIGRMV
jgi:hypothetical protein